MDRVILLVAVGLTSATFLIPGVRNAVCRNFPDDALFYNVVARNLVSGLGSTSDGIALSNGYHPLWMGFHCGLALLFRHTLTPEVFLELAINAVAVLLLYQLLLPYGGRFVALLICLVTSYEQTFFRVLWSGMETQLAWLFFLAVLLVLRRTGWSGLRGRRKVLLGALLTLLFFSRLDGGLFWVALATVCLFHGSIRREDLARRARGLFGLFIIPTLIVAAYLILNAMIFSTPTPVSGRIKNLTLGDIAHMGIGPYLGGAVTRAYFLYSFDAISRVVRAVGMGRMESTVVFRLLYLVIFCGAVGLAVVGLARRFRDDLSVRALAGYVALHTVYYTFLQADTYSLSWAKGPELLLICVAAVYWLGRAHVFGAATAWRRCAAAGALIAILAAGLVYHGIRVRRVQKIDDFNTSTRDFFDGMAFIRKRFPVDTCFLTSNLGYLGYFSGRRAMSYDGLLNSLAYFRDYKRKGRAMEWVEQHGIRYVATRVGASSDPAKSIARQFDGLKPSQVKVIAAFTAGAKQGGVENGYAVAELRFDDGRSAEKESTDKVTDSPRISPAARQSDGGAVSSGEAKRDQ